MTIQGFRITNKGRTALIAMQENNKQDEEAPAHYRIADALAEAGLLAPEPGGEAMSYEYAVQYKTPDGWKYSRESWDCRWQDNEAVQHVRAYRDHPGQETRIVRRLVSTPEVIDE
ncbi:hypothetical protein [Corynebacterium striatum]|uniref:hypothetical protein n=1 Tax=Corynebacterium striatum TaxID=43770 RepID=UPI0027BAD055|nr:hypothetical protein [Corynebacterium striatum]